jgi:hypothetical protein
MSAAIVGQSGTLVIVEHQHTLIECARAHVGENKERRRDDQDEEHCM